MGLLLFKFFNFNIMIIKDILIFEAKCSKIIQIFLPKRSYPDPVQLFRIRIQHGQKVPNPNGSDFSTLVQTCTLPVDI
jgi:hypothetical protein